MKRDEHLCVPCKSMSLSAFEDAAVETLAELTPYRPPQSTAGAIVACRFTTWYPAGSNAYGPTGTRSTRFVLARDQGMVTPDTSQMKITAKAANGTGLNSDAGIGAALSRLRLFCAGALVEDTSRYGRIFSTYAHDGKQLCSREHGSHERDEHGHLRLVR